MGHIVDRRTGEIMIDECTQSIIRAKMTKGINRSHVNYLLTAYANTHESELDELMHQIKLGNIEVNERR